jgi:hypothetical protein
LLKEHKMKINCTLKVFPTSIKQKTMVTVIVNLKTNWMNLYLKYQGTFFYSYLREN